jgi:N-acetylmuramoyl-L-alanine amidase
MFKPDYKLANVVPAATNQIGPERTPSLIVLHSAETSETATSAESVANYFGHGSGGRSASAHYTVDNDSTVQSVPERNMSWGAVGVNKWGIHIEMAGRAAQTAQQWDDQYSHRMIYSQLVPLLTNICRRYPVIHTEYLDVPSLVKQWRSGTNIHGITTHANVSAAAQALGKKSSGHSDPGRGFPTLHVIEVVKAALH